MAILYTLVVRSSVVLAEFSATSTNASVIASQLLDKLPGTHDSHVSYTQDRYVFHVKCSDGLTVLCIADETAGSIHQRFIRTYGCSIHSAQSYSTIDEVARVLSQQMEYYSNDPNADRINRLKAEMGQVRNVMIGNIDKVLERGDHLELLVDKNCDYAMRHLPFQKASSPSQKHGLVEKCQTQGCTHNSHPS